MKAWMTSNFGHIPLPTPELSALTRLNQRTNGPVNAHLISGSRISTEHTNPK